MCTVCGCDSPTTMETKVGDQHHTHSHDHAHTHTSAATQLNRCCTHDHGHAHAHDSHAHHADQDDGVLDYGAGAAKVHVPGQSQERLIQIERDILGKNNDLAERNRRVLTHNNVLTLNLLSSPGSGKTTLLTETLTQLAGTVPMAVIEGDQQTSNDADRIRATGVEALQINTGKGCHLDADMVGHALMHLNLPRDGYLFIENVGNLVCPASFDLGEQVRVVLASTTEGEDKPVKYPDMFATADVVLMTKADLLPHLSFDVAAFEASVKQVNHKAQIIPVASTQDGGLDAWVTWLKAQRSSDQPAQAIQAAE